LNIDLNWIDGSEMSAVSLVEPVSWWFKFSDGASLRVDAQWRVVTEEGVQVTSADHGHQFGLPEPVDAGGRAMRVLAHAKVLGAAVLKPAGDLVFDFSNGAKLEILTTSSAYEGWSLTSPNGDEIIGLGGGRVQVLKGNF
jgi:hypothetical protein